MNEFRKIIIEENRENILRDLTHENEIICHLLSKEVITSDDHDNIIRSRNKGAKLLDILLKKNEGPWFEEFCEALRSDYPWITDQLLDQFNLNSSRKKEFYLNIRGQVPLLPQRNVHRSQYITQLQGRIKDLKRSNYLVIHGMSGCGKTSLASNALNNVTLLEDAMQGCVYWLSASEIKDEETAEDLCCQELQKRLCDIVGLTANPQKDLLSQLKHFFATDPNYKALLVLDNVMSPNVIKALDIGCKILITTEDCGVMTDVKQRCQMFPVQNGFTESESVQLLTEFVMDGKGPLPHRIRQCAINIHQVWKGQPMVIGLIGGHLADKSEEAVTDELCWKEYEKNPFQDSNGDFALRRRSLVEHQMTSVIGKTINKLTDDLKSLYQMLAVLVEDANITCEVLETLWSKHRSDAECTMNTFCRRSLAVKKHHPFLKVWVYGIHAMLVANLKEKFTTDQLRHMHQELLLKYNEKCGGDLSQLSINDNYIFTYLCHHIEKAREWDRYRDQFFNLNYLQSKLLATGPGDLLLDLRKYHNGLVGNNENYKRHIQDIVKFVESSGWEIYKNKLDLIQCALLEPTDSVINIWATQTVKSDQSTKLFFFPLCNLRNRPKEIEYPVSNVKALCIIPSTHSDGRVLVAPDDKGFVAEVDMRFRGKRRVFEVPRVSVLCLSKYQDKFLSGSEDGFVKIWSLTSENTTNANTPPPSIRQRNYENFDVSQIRTVPSLSKEHIRQVTSASFSHDGQKVVSASDAGDVVIWNVETDKEERTISVHPSPAAVSCAFLTENDMIVYGCSDYKIYFYDIHAGQVKVTEETDRNLGRIINILPVSDDIRKIIVVQLKAISVWSWDAKILVHQSVGVRKTEFQGLTKRLLLEEIPSITCAAYAERCLVIGTSKQGCCFLNIDDVDNKKWIGVGMITGVDLSRDRLVYSTGGSVRMCWPEMGSSLSNPNQGSVVALGWSFKNVSICASASRNKMLVFHDGKLIHDRLVLKDISVICISPDGDHVFAGCSDGEVLSLDTVSHTYNSLARLPSKVTYLQCKMFNKDAVYVAAADPTHSNEMENGVKDRHYLEVITKHSHVSLQCPDLSSSLVETFINFNSLMAVLRDYSVLVWHLHSWRGGSRPIAHQILHEGRGSARANGAAITDDKKFLVISDEEKCFHVFSIDWPEERKVVDSQGDEIITRQKGFGLKKIYIPPTAYGVNNQSVSSLSSFGSLMNSIDEVDGGVNSIFSVFPSTSMATYELPDPAWCCDVSCDGELIALGCGVNKVHVWNAAMKLEVAKFDVQSNSHAKVSHLKFSKSDIIISNKSFKSVLLVVTDCFSLWDMSPLVSGSSAGPTLLACVKAGGLPFVDISVSSSFSKFSGIDSSKTYFLWEIK